MVLYLFDSWTVPCMCLVQSICIGGKHNVILVQLNDGSLYRLNFGENLYIYYNFGEYYNISFYFTYILIFIFQMLRHWSHG